MTEHTSFPKNHVEKNGLIFQIGKPTESGYINIIVNFNPLRRTQFFKYIEDLPSVNCVTCAQRHDEESGGYAILLNTNCDAYTLSDEISKMIQNLIL